MIFKQSTIPQLESKLSSLMIEHDLASAAFSTARARIEQIADRCTEGADASIFVERLAVARADEAASRSHLATLETAIANTKLALVALREKPEREAAHNALHATARDLELALRKAAPALRALTDAYARVPNLILENLPGAAPAILAHIFPHAADSLEADAISILIERLKSYGDEVVTGHRLYDLGVSIGEKADAFARPTFSRTYKVRDHEAIGTL